MDDMLTMTVHPSPIGASWKTVNDKKEAGKMRFKECQVVELV